MRKPGSKNKGKAAAKKNDKYRGTGIGLAIVKKIVENHNGHIIATGEIGKGARFDVYIPVSE